MARPARIGRENGLYHVTSRGNARSDIFRRDGDRERFLDRLGDNLETFEVILHAYVLMDNHFHLVVRTPQANLSAFMQRLLTSYALYARYRHKRPGHVFQGRFKAKLVESDRYLRDVSRYVHLNPVKTKAAARLSFDERRRRLEEYRWSSYWTYLRAGLGEEFLQIGPVLRLFSENVGAARRAYRRYVESGLARTDEETLALMNGHGHAIGSDEFIDEVEVELDERRTGKITDADIALPRRRVDLDTIASTVARRYGIEVGRLRADGRRAGEAKAVAVELACRLSGETQRRVGAYFGGVSSSAVGKLRGAIRAEKDRRAVSPRLDSIDELESSLVRDDG